MRGVAVADVAGGHQAEGRARLRQAGQSGHRVRLLAVQAAQGNLAVRLGNLGTVRLHHQRTAVGVQNGAAAHRHGGNAVPQLHHRGYAQAAGHNGGVADRAVLIAGQPQHHAPVKAEQIAGEKAVCHQNTGPLQVQAAARAAIQNIHHPAADIADINTALPDVLIIDIF